MRDGRTKKQDAKLPGRRCKICKLIGGHGATTNLRLLGFDVPHGTIGYAHGPCLARAQRLLKRSEAYTRAEVHGRISAKRDRGNEG